MTIRRFLTVAVAAALTALAFSNAPQPATAAVIAWGSPQQITGSSDVSTTGSLFASANFGGSNTTVNSVTFTAFPITSGTTTVTVGNITVTGSSMEPATYNSFTPPFSDLPVSYRNLLAPVVQQSAGSPTLNFTVSGLTVGETYAIQYWVNDPRTNSLGRTIRVGGTNGVVLDPNTNGDSSGGLGQWAIGQFVADSTSQNFTAAAATGSFSIANAMQIRVVPEPSAIAILAAAAGMGAMVRLRRSRREADVEAAGRES